MLKEGMRFEVSETVTECNVARAAGSGDLDVYATPSMVALMERAAMECVRNGLGDGETTVGTAISVKHLRGSVIGHRITADAELRLIDGRRLVFEVSARDGEHEIGTGSHERFIVDSEKFMNRIK